MRTKLIELCSGNMEAVNFVEGFWTFMEAWDDVIDRDKPPDDEATNKAILWALFDMQDDPFYRAYNATLRGSVQHAVATWLMANKFERSGDPTLVEQAYFMRCSAYDVFAVVVLLASGSDMHMRAVEYFRSLAPEDRLAKYMIEHLGERHGMAQFQAAASGA